MEIATTPPDSYEQLVDHNLDRVLRAAGTGLRNYRMAFTVTKMREAMRNAMEHQPSPAPVESDNARTIAVLEALHAELARMNGWQDSNSVHVVGKEMVLLTVQNKIDDLKGELAMRE